MLHHLRRSPDRPAIASVTSGSIESWAGSELIARIAGAGTFLDEESIPAGELVPALLTQRPESVALLLAGALTNRPLAPLSPRMTFHELSGCLALLPGEVLVSEPTSLELAKDLAWASGKRLVVVDEVDRVAGEVAPNDDPEAVVFAMHTSGTTGLPKRVAVKEGPLGHRGDVNGYLLDVQPGDRLVTTSLFHHVGGLGNIAVALANGATLVTFPSFSVEAWQEIGVLEPTHSVTVPSVIEMLLAAGALSLPTLKVLGYGGSPIHPQTMRRLQDVIPHAELVNLFGQTEGSPITVLDPDDHRLAASSRPELLGSVGKPAPGAEVIVHEPDDKGMGEVWVRSPHSFLTDDEGWQHTGDIGHFGEDGYLYLVGRRGDKIIRGGENVYPLEVEQVLTLHGAVEEAAVVGIPDQRLGETVLAYIVPADPGSPPDTEELRAFARERLAGFKVPVAWEFVDVLPKNTSGKVLRRELAARAAERSSS